MYKGYYICDLECIYLLKVYIKNDKSKIGLELKKFTPSSSHGIDFILIMASLNGKMRI